MTLEAQIPRWGSGEGSTQFKALTAIAFVDYLLVHARGGSNDIMYSLFKVD